MAPSPRNSILLPHIESRLPGFPLNRTYVSLPLIFPTTPRMRLLNQRLLFILYRRKYAVSIPISCCGVASSASPHSHYGARCVSPVLLDPPPASRRNAGRQFMNRPQNPPAEPINLITHPGPNSHASLPRPEVRDDLGRAEIPAVDAELDHLSMHFGSDA